jgi:hypothetical protein
VSLVHDDARSWMARSERSFDLIQMSLIDTWASTSAGAMTLTENGLYTLEAWTLFLERLKPGGVLSVSRFYWPESVSETARGLSLAVAALVERGAPVPADHVALVASRMVATLIVSRSPLSAGDVATLRAEAALRGFRLIALPGEPVADAVLQEILAARSHAELLRATRHRHYDLGPPTDDRPFFFNILKLSAWRQVPPARLDVGLLAGNLRATGTLAALLFAVLVVIGLSIAVPLLLRGGGHGLETPAFLAAASYFSLIGLGFMLIELGLMQRFSILLGHPIHSLSITLMSMILAAGIGSLLSERIAPSPRGRLVWLPLFAAGVAASGALAGRVPVDLAMAWPLPARAAVVVLFTLPIGLLLGCFFPLGMRLLAGRGPAARSWMWGLNGAWGVLGSLASVLLAMSSGIASCILAGAACYALLALPLRVLLPRR